MSDLKKDIEEFLKSYDIERYAEIGRKGGKKGAADGVTKGFAAMPHEKRVAAGRLGGSISKRGKTTVENYVPEIPEFKGTLNKLDQLKLGGL